MTLGKFDGCILHNGEWLSIKNLLLRVSSMGHKVITLPWHLAMLPSSRCPIVLLFCIVLFCFTLISILLVFLCILIVLYSDSSSELVPLGLLLYCIINNIYLICNAFNIPKLENKEDYKWKVLIMSCKI